MLKKKFNKGVKMKGTIRKIYDSSDDNGFNFGVYFAEKENIKVFVRAEDLRHLKEGDVVEYTINSEGEGSAGPYGNAGGMRVVNDDSKVASNNGSGIMVEAPTKKPYQEVENDKSEDMFVMGFIGRFVENGHITLEQVNQDDTNLSSTLKNLRNAWRKSKQ